jgi:tetratricopeptide (TPR) repeat protein
MPSMISGIHSARHIMLSGKAHEALESLTSFDVPFVSLAIVRGECHYVLGHWNEAVLEFENALRLSPNSPRAEIMLGLASEMVELSNIIRPPASIEHLLGVKNESDEVLGLPKLSLPPRDQESTEADVSSDEIGLVSETLAEVMIRQSKFDDARKVYIQLSRLNPDRYEYFRECILKLDEHK